MWRALDSICEVLDVLVFQTLFVRAAIENLKSGDFVFVVVDELLEGLDDGLGFFCRIGGETCFQNAVFRDGIDGLLERFLQFDELVAKSRIRSERLGGFSEEGSSGFFDFLGGRRTARSGCATGSFNLLIGIERADNFTSDRGKRAASGKIAEHAVIFLGELAVEAGEARSER